MRTTSVISAAVVAGLTVAGSVLGSASTASAAGCLKSVIEYTGYRAPNTYQYVVKGTYGSNTTCHDLNVIESLGGGSSASGESYAGFYYKASTKQWIQGSRGYVWINDGTHGSGVVLLSDVKGGTRMSVGTWSREGAWVYLAY